MKTIPLLFPTLPLVLLTATVEAQISPRKLEPVQFQPAGRSGHAAAFDAVRNQMVVFGGCNGTGVLGDTLVNGVAWSQLNPTPAPFGRFGVQMVFAPDKGTCLLYGGTDAVVWSWNGTAWSSSSQVGPLNRRGHAMAYDVRRKKLVLNGGLHVDFNNHMDDTWEYDAATGWTQIKVNDPPTGRTGAVMVDAPLVGGLLMLGGRIANGNVTSQAYVWNGKSWNNVGVPTGPDKRMECAMCFDSDQNTIFVFGGFDGTKVLGDTWCGYGLTWINRTNPAGPGPRRGASLVYDSKAKRCVLFGGVDANSQYPNDVWEWNQAALQWTQRPVAPPPVKLAPAGPRRGG